MYFQETMFLELKSIKDCIILDYLFIYLFIYVSFYTHHIEISKYQPSVLAALLYRERHYVSVQSLGFYISVDHKYRSWIVEGTLKKI